MEQQSVNIEEWLRMAWDKTASKISEKYGAIVLMSYKGNCYSFEKDSLSMALANVPISFPVSQLDTYLPKLIKGGNKVAIADALETPEQMREAQKKVRESEVEKRRQMRELDAILGGRFSQVVAKLKAKQQESKQAPVQLNLFA